MKSPSNPKYRSQFERKLATFLECAGTHFSYETSVINYKRASVYVPDFYLPEVGFFIEAKGYFSPQDRGKHLLVKRENPKIQVRFVFQNAYQTLSKKSSTTYAKWCEQHGFLWAHKVIPTSWLS